MIVKTLSPLLIFLLLSGCSASSSARPTESIHPSETQAEHSSPIAAPSVEPSEVPSISPIGSEAQPTSFPTVRPAPAPTAVSSATAPAAPAAPSFTYPIGTPGRPLGDGFFIRHGTQVENTWYNPGYWHTGEDWYAVEGDTAGARVYTIADGEVVYAAANYPGRVVIVRHAPDLYSMYGHLDPALAVDVGQNVRRGDLIGTVLRRNDKTPNHLHFELRTFLTKREVNGAAPRYPFRCGVGCPPGPGYWPTAAPDLPADLGWRNPTHAINRRMLPEGTPGEIVVASKPISKSVTLWSSSPGDPARAVLDTLALSPGARYTLLAVDAGAEDTRETSALAYRLWYRIGLPDGRAGWVQAAVPSTFETGSDGRPSSVYLNFVPSVDAVP